MMISPLQNGMTSFMRIARNSGRCFSASVCIPLLQLEYSDLLKTILWPPCTWSNSKFWDSENSNLLEFSEYCIPISLSIPRVWWIWSLPNSRSLCIPARVRTGVPTAPLLKSSSKSSPFFKLYACLLLGSNYFSIQGKLFKMDVGKPSITCQVFDTGVF